MKQIMYYHNDPDGFASASSFLLKYPELELVPCNYGDTITPVEHYDIVILADFHFEQDIMNSLQKNNKQFIWIDHHKSSITKIKGKFEGVLDDSKAACQLCWEFNFPNKPIPPIIQHIADEDLWQFNNTYTKQFMLYLNLLFEEKKEPYIIKKIITDWNTQEYNTAYEKGNLLDTYRNAVLEEQSKKGIITTFQKVKAFIAFTNNNTSHLGNYVLNKYANIDIAVLISIRENSEGKKVFKYSLRSRKQGVDVNKLANQCNGGGHPQAAGFESETLILN